MEVIRVTETNVRVIAYILTHLIDPLDKKDELRTTGYLERFISDDRTYLLAAIIDDTVVGYTLAYRFPSLYASGFFAYLYDIEVSAIHRRKGVGRLLIETLIAYLKTNRVIELEEGQGLFTSTGAVKSGETFNDYTYYLG